MSGPQGHHEYGDGYGQQPNPNPNNPNRDSYYQDDHQQYYDNGYDAQGGHNGGDGYYDESCVALPHEVATGR